MPFSSPTTASGISQRSLNAHSICWPLPSDLYSSAGHDSRVLFAPTVDSLELLGAHLFSGQISRKGPSRFGFPVSQPNIKFRFSPLGITPQLMLRSRSVALFPGNTDRIPLPVNRLIQIIITRRSVRTSPLTMEIRGLPQNRGCPKT